VKLATWEATSHGCTFDKELITATSYASEMMEKHFPHGQIVQDGV
jgi:hypothetical protein